MKKKKKKGGKFKIVSQSLRKELTGMKKNMKRSWG